MRRAAQSVHAQSLKALVGMVRTALGNPRRPQGAGATRTTAPAPRRLRRRQRDGRCRCCSAGGVSQEVGVCRGSCGDREVPGCGPGVGAQAPQPPQPVDHLDGTGPAAHDPDLQAAHRQTDERHEDCHSHHDILLQGPSKRNVKRGSSPAAIASGRHHLHPLPSTAQPHARSTAGPTAGPGRPPARHPATVQRTSLLSTNSAHGCQCDGARQAWNDPFLRLDPGVADWEIPAGPPSRRSDRPGSPAPRDLPRGDARTGGVSGRTDAKTYSALITCTCYDLSKSLYQVVWQAQDTKSSPGGGGPCLTCSRPTGRRIPRCQHLAPSTHGARCGCD